MKPAWMYTVFTLGDMVSKHVWARQWHKKPIQLKPQSIERPSAQMVIHAETFNKVCEALNKVHNAQWTDWDLRVPAVLWAYRTMCKKLTAHAPSRLEYEAHVVIRENFKNPPKFTCIINGRISMVYRKNGRRFYQ